ncbi:MAG: DsbA family oxidoreductase [Rhodobacteraceae bacterium]|nr:DsbA family oxidoreductase [Paracoccaceae bacterium]
MTTLEIISDPICPWCYIGKAKLEKALAQMPDHPFEITWKPFQLNPDMPAAGMDRREYLEQKFGGQKGAIKVYSQIAQTAEAAGLDIDFAKMLRTPNTIDAHRLIHWARLDGKQNTVVDELFNRFFKEGQDISDHSVLIEAAKAAGMDSEMVIRLLATDADIAETRDADQKARAMGITGVPTFLIDGQYVVSGAQETTFWLNLIEEISEMQRKTTDESQTN